MSHNSKEVSDAEWFFSYKPEFWRELSEEEQNTTGMERSFLSQMAKKSAYGETPAPPQLKWAREMVGRIGGKHQMEGPGRKPSERKAAEKEGVAMKDITHVSVRMAWHDSEWNGCICKDPEANTYCVGTHSLLNGRIEKRRDLDFEKADKNRGASLSTLPEEKIPPCSGQSTHSAMPASS